MVRGRLNKIIYSITTKNNLHVIIKPDLIRQMIKRNEPTSINRSGISLPLACVEPRIVSCIVQMSRIHESFSPTQALRLVNSVIDRTPA